MSFTCDSKTARIQHGVLCGCNIDLKAELLKGPAVCLCNILPCSSNVCLWYKQATEAHVDVLMEEGWGKRIAIITDITSSILIYVKIFLLLEHCVTAKLFFSFKSTLSVTVKIVFFPLIYTLACWPHHFGIGRYLTAFTSTIMKNWLKLFCPRNPPKESWYVDSIK